MTTVVCSLNLWNVRRWSERRSALQGFLQRSQPDVLALQELRPKTQSEIDGILPEHERIHDQYPGWAMEGNVYWRKTLYTYLDHGEEDIGAVEEYSRLYWVRLRTLEKPSVEVLFATAHFTAGNKPEEAQTAVNPRLAETDRCIEHLCRLNTETGRTVFMGDLNEDEHPRWRLAKFGFTDVCSALGRLPEPTTPAFAWANHIPAVDDWIYFRGPLRPMTFEVAHCHADPLPPSDHHPVLATFRL